jgi:hypothetical protein
MKNKCFCGCGLRRNPKRRFHPGHNQYRRESAERNLTIHQARRGRAPAVKIYQGRMPLRIRPRKIHHEL